MKKALLVAICDGPTREIVIPSAAVSVQTLATALLTSAGFAPANTKILQAPADTAAGNIQAEITGWLIQNAKPGDVLLFGINGHGGINPNGTYFIPSDGANGALLSENEVAGWLAAATPTASTYALYDCCRLPDVTWRARFELRLQQRLAVAARARSLVAAPATPRPPLVTLYGCSPFEPGEYDNSDGCAFTHYFSSRLSSPGGLPIMANVIQQTRADLLGSLFAQTPVFSPPSEASRPVFS